MEITPQELRRQKKSFYLAVIMGVSTLLIIIFSALYLWRLIPTLDLVSIDGRSSVVELKTFVGSILREM
jgi:hypothetical protein